MDRKFIKLFSFYLLLLKHLSRRISGFQSMFDSCPLFPPNFVKLENDRWTLLFHTQYKVNNNFQLKKKSLFFLTKKKKTSQFKIPLGLNRQMMPPITCVKNWLLNKCVFFFFLSAESKIMRIRKNDVTLLLKWHTLLSAVTFLPMPIALTNLPLKGNKINYR